MSNRKLFGTDGVRGIAGDYPLDEAGCIKIGKAIAAHFAKKPGSKVVIAWDPRESSETLVSNVVNGLTSESVDVVKVGVIPTPGLAYITRENDFAAGVMITASHNPVEYNGIKVFDEKGDKLDDNTEAAINQLIDSSIPDQEIGKILSEPNLKQQYIDFVKNSVDGVLDQKVVIDCANGASSETTNEIFKSILPNLTIINDQPNGQNINKNCGATDTESLKELVVSQKYNLGIAFDGDADRIILIDSRGNELNGDYILYMLAKSLNVDGIVTTVMSNIGLDKALYESKVKVKRVSVGDRYVLEGMKETGYLLGGEQAGHIILGDLLKTGDGTLTAAQIIQGILKTNKSLDKWHDELVLYPQALINIPLKNKDILESQQIKDYISIENSALDGRGRLLIRPSGTEPLARVMVESEDAKERCERIANKLKELSA